MDHDAVIDRRPHSTFAQPKVDNDVVAAAAAVAAGVCYVIRERLANVILIKKDSIISIVIYTDVCSN